MSSQIELRANVSSELADLLEGHFHECGTATWGILQRERGSPYEVFGFFPDVETANTELLELRELFPELPSDFESREITDEEWTYAYKAYVTPWSDRQLHWIPLWERDQIHPPEGSAKVYLDAGMAFGTGSHETTRLCASRLIDYYEASPDRFEQARIIDAGCGSGVLAFSASGLGGRNLYAFDNDPEAITVCHENCAHNPHLDRPYFAGADLQKGLAGEQADLLLANIQADVLIPHSDPVVMGVKPGGTIAISGILVKEIEEVRQHYTERFAALRPDDVISLDSRIDGEWADLCIQLRSR